MVGVLARAIDVIEEDVLMTAPKTGPTVESAMTVSPVVISQDESIAAVAELLAGYDISGLPVVDSDDRLVGVVSQTDLVRLQGSSIPWTGWHGLIVRDVMTLPARTIDASASLDEAARQMTNAHVHRLIVVDADRAPIGVISESDLIREIADACDDC